MTGEEFKRLPFLLAEAEVIAATGYAHGTIAKYIDNGVLTRVRPEGAGQARYRKAQVAALLRLEDLLDWTGFRREPLLMPEKQVTVWTGYARDTLARMVASGALGQVRPAGTGQARYQKRQVGALIGFPGKC